MQEWEFSKKTGNENIEEGWHNAVITDCQYDPETYKYTLFFRMLNPTAKVKTHNAAYFLKKQDGTDNNTSIGVLHKMSRVVRGATIEGVLAPCDVVGGLVKFNAKKNGQYINIYEYADPDADIIDAYFDGKLGDIIPMVEYD